MSKYITASYPVKIANGIKIDTSYIQTHNCIVKSGRTISYIVMHYSGNLKDKAINNAKYYHNNDFTGTDREGVSAHYFVDDYSIYQSTEVKNRAGHCGTKGKYYSACRNDTSIGIEMCCTAGNYTVSKTTINNAAYLCAELCKELNISVNDVDTYVIRHYDVTHKPCPKQWVNDESEFVAFKNSVKNILSGGLSMTQYEELKKENEALKSEIKALKDSQEKVYHYTVDVPDWGRPTIQKLLDKGLYNGASESDLNLSESLMRTLVINDRAGLYD